MWPPRSGGTLGFGPGTDGIDASVARFRRFRASAGRRTFHANIYHEWEPTPGRKTVSLSRRVKDWLTLPELDATTYECVDCGVLAGSVEPECPECGGDVEPVDLDPRYLYWDPMM